MTAAFHQNPSVNALIARIGVPLLLIEGDRVAQANPSALSLLGAHIVGQDVRLALRHPDAVALLSGAKGGHATIPGLSTPTSLWGVSVQSLGGSWRLAELRDLSAQSDVSRAHTDFVANASHELRTPLAAIIGYVETLLEPRTGSDAPTRTRFLEIVLREARRLQQLVEDLMSLSRIEAVKHERPEQIVDLAAITRQVADDINAGHDARPSVMISGADLPAPMAGDSVQLSQLVRNLVENGIRHGGASEPVAIALVRDGKTLSLEISDRGAGIEAQHLPRLTERFYRVDASRSRDAGGTGLGLAIVKHIVERHRGSLDIQSRPGAGTRVSVRFPSGAEAAVIKA